MLKMHENTLKINGKPPYAKPQNFVATSMDSNLKSLHYNFNQCNNLVQTRLQYIQWFSLLIVTLM